MEILIQAIREDPMPRPILSYIRVSNICNAKCFMCGVYNQEPISLSLSDISIIIEYLASFGTQEVRLTGGECTIHPYFNEIIQLISRNGMLISFITNGNSLNSKMIDELINNPSVREIIFSLDSKSPQIHNTLKGIDSYDNVLHAIRKIGENSNIKIVINTCVSKYNIRHLERLSELNEFRYVMQWNLIPIKGRESDKMSVEDTIIFNEKRGSANFEKVLNKDIVSNMGRDDYTSIIYKGLPCSLANYTLFIDFNGDVYPCNSFSEIHKNSLLIGNCLYTEMDELMVKRNKIISLLGSINCNLCDPLNIYLNRLLQNEL